VSSDRVYNPQYAKELIEIAEQDLESARVLASSEKGRQENTLFLVQQVVEKCLKAIICHKRQAVPFSHDVEALVVRLSDESVPHAEAIAELTPYATIRRYEEGRFTITKEDKQAALSVAAEVLNWAKARLRS
jgi:HEPN domain-containing protein